MDFILFSRILLRRKWLILGTSLVCAIITFTLAKFTLISYNSHAQLATGITDNFEVTLSDSKSNRDEIKNKYNNLSEFLKSKDLLTLVSYRLVLHDLEAPKPFRPKKLAKAREGLNDADWKKLKTAFQAKYDNFQGVSGLVKEDLVLKDFAKDLKYDYNWLDKELSVTRIVETDYVEAKVSTENPYLSSFLVNAFCEEAIRFNNYQQTKRSQYSLDFFRKLVTQKKENLDRKLDSLKRFKEVAEVVNHEAETLKKLDQIAEIESKRNEEIKNVNSLNRVLAHLERQIAGVAGTASSDNAYINNKIYALKDRINDLNSRHISSGKKDRVVEDSLRLLRRQLNSLVEKLQEENQTVKSQEELASKKINTEIELEQAKSSLSTLENTLMTMKSQLTGYTISGNEVANLEMSVEVAKQEYLQILEKYNAAKNVALNSGMLLRQIEFGEPADEPEPSKTIILTVLSMVFSVSMFVVFFFVREYLDNTLKTPFFFKKHLPFGLLGIVNKISDKNIHVSMIFKQNADSLEHQRFKEYLRKLRVEFEPHARHTTMFTSLKQGEGKSFVLFSLAYSLSLIGRKILIIDTNFKNNTLTSLFSAPQELPDLPFENLPVRQLYGGPTDTNVTIAFPVFEHDGAANFIHNTSYKNIYIIGCKGSEKSPSELFQGKNFEVFLGELKNQFDYIFLEGPSLNEYSDSKELINFIDKVVIVYAADTSISQTDQLSIDYLKGLNDKHIGSILNMVDLKNLSE